MNFLTLLKNWKNISEVWKLIEPFVLNLVKKQVPKLITKLYENLAKYTEPVINSLFNLKEKINQTPSELDNYCFEQGVNALDSFANYLQGVVENLRK